jgi:hypothetical protein
MEATLKVASILWGFLGLDGVEHRETRCWLSSSACSLDICLKVIIDNEETLALARHGWPHNSFPHEGAPTRQFQPLR